MKHLQEAQFHFIKVTLEAYASMINVFPRGEAPVPTPGRFHTMDMGQLLSSKLREKVVSCYQEVYGSDETNDSGETLWGEGAYCTHEGWTRLISLPEFKKRAMGGDIRCDCGGEFVLCYPVGKLIHEMERELKDGVEPTLTVMNGDSSLPIGGFAWGATCTLEQISKRLIYPRYENDASVGQQLVDELAQKIQLNGVGSCVLFFDELAVRREFRGGVEPIQFLIRPILEAAKDYTRNALFRTSVRSPIYDLSVLMGFLPIHVRDGSVFLYNPDFTTLLKIVQNIPAKTISVILARIYHSSLKQS